MPDEECRREARTSRAIVLAAVRAPGVGIEALDPMATAIRGVLAGRPRIEAEGDTTLVVTVPGVDRKGVAGVADAVAAALARLTASTGFPYSVSAAWCRPRRPEATVLMRAWIALGVAWARADATPVVWRRSAHRRLMDASAGDWPEVDRPRGWLRRSWSWWSRRHPGLASAQLVGLTYAIALGGPFLAYLALWRVWDINAIDPAFWVAFGLLNLTTGVLFAEGLLAIEPGVVPPEPDDAWPSLTVLVPAWLPNEHRDLPETLRWFLVLEYPGSLEVICAYNTDAPMPVAEAALAALAREDPRLRILNVTGSRTKAQNLNAALRTVTSDMVGIFDADHRPDPDALRRAARWIAAGWDGVQGRCTVRLPPNPSRCQRLVAIEFETIYGVAHPGRARRDRFAIFGGSNGYWRTPALRALRFAPDRLTEDIDLSARALLAGLRLATDRGIVSSELPPADLAAFWVQRGRWAQGWTQVSHRWLPAILRAPRLRPRQKLGACLLFGLRELTPWVTLQLYPILAFHALTSVGHEVVWLLPAFVFSTLLSLGVGAWQAAVAWWWADPRHRDRREYLRYVAHNIVWFSELKMLVSRVAHVRAVLGETQWRVTRRAAQPAVALAPEPADLAPEHAGPAVHRPPSGLVVDLA